MFSEYLIIICNLLIDLKKLIWYLRNNIKYQWAIGLKAFPKAKFIILAPCLSSSSHFSCSSVRCSLNLICCLQNRSLSTLAKAVSITFSSCLRPRDAIWRVLLLYSWASLFIRGSLIKTELLICFFIYSPSLLSFVFCLSKTSGFLKYYLF